MGLITLFPAYVLYRLPLLVIPRATGLLQAQPTISSFDVETDRNEKVVFGQPEFTHAGPSSLSLLEIHCHHIFRYFTNASSASRTSLAARICDSSLGSIGGETSIKSKPTTFNSDRSFIVSKPSRGSMPPCSAVPVPGA